MITKDPNKQYVFLLVELNEPTYTWSGRLPPRNHKNPVYSNKVFLGGVPWDITDGEVSRFYI